MTEWHRDQIAGVSCGEIEKTIESLEATLDISIITHHSNKNDVALPKPFSLMFPNNKESESKIMAKVAKYRIENPSPNPDPKVKNSIESAVNYYLQKNAF